MFAMCQKHIHHNNQRTIIVIRTDETGLHRSLHRCDGNYTEDSITLQKNHSHTGGMLWVP